MAGEVKLRLSLDGAAQVTTGLRSVSGALGDAATRGDRAAEALKRVGHYGAGLLALGGVGQVARSVAALSDEFATLSGRLRTVTDGQAQFAQAQAAVVEIAQRQRKGLSEIGTLYASASAAASELGATQQDVARFTEGVAASLTLNGTSAQAAAGALLQLSQAVGGSVVQAQEFNSLIDGARPLLVAAAKHIDGAAGSVSRLKQMVNDGRLSSQEFFRAIVNASDELTQSAAQMPVTIGQGMTLVRNQALLLVGALDAGTGASRVAAGALALVARNLDALAVIAGGAAALGMGRLAQATADSVQAMLVKRAAAVAELADTVRRTEAVAIHTGFVLADARATLAHATGLGASVVAQNAVIAATTRHTAALAAQAAAQTALSRATSIGAAAMGLMGGPIGLVVTALGLGATAWAAWSAASSRAGEQAVAATRRSTAEIIADLDRQTAKIEAMNRLRQQPGGKEAAATGGEEAERLAEANDRIAELMNGTGKAAAMPEATRQAVLQATLKEYAALDARMRAGADAKAERDQFLNARSIDDVAQYAKLDIDIKRKWSNESIEIAKAYGLALAKEADPAKRAALESERDLRLIAGQQAMDKALAGAAAAPRVSRSDDRPDPLAERIALMQGLYGAGPDTRQQDFRRAELEDQPGVERALAAAREADQAKADSAIDAARKAADGIVQANREGNIALIEDDRARVAAQVALEREHALAMIEPLRAMPEEYARALAGVNEAAALKTRELTRNLKDEATLFTEQAARNIQDVLGSTVEATLSGNFKNIGKMWLDMLNRMIAQAAAAKLGEALMGDYGKSGKVGGGLGSLIGLISAGVGLFTGSAAASTPTGFNADGSAFNNISAWVPSGGRASGGPVLAGATYLVGERGPELLRMGAMGGSVTPNHALGGDVKVNIINNAGAEVGVRRGGDGEIEIMLERAAETGARRGYARAVADVASGTGRLSAALAGRGVNLGNAALRRA
jgi:tape measure domain-containing protein